MNLSWVGPLVNRGKQWAIKHAPGILMGMGTVGSITAVIFAVEVTPTASTSIRLVRTKKTAEKFHMTTAEVEEQCVESEYVKLTPMETVKAAGIFYIPAIGIELFSLLCFWGAHGIDVKRQAVIAGLYSTAEEALREYQKKVQEIVGTDVNEEIRNSVAQDYVNKNPPPVQKTVILPDDTDIWWIVDGQYFRSNLNQIKKVENDINHEMICNMYASRADLYWLLDPEKKYLRTKPEDGMVGWSVDNLLVLEHDWGDGPDGRPVGIIHYKDKDGLEYLPQPGYSRMA